MIKFSPGRNEPQVAVTPIHGTSLNVALVYTRNSPALLSALKRTKGYKTVEDVRPTLRNKPSGLRPDWHRTVSNSSMPLRQTSATYPRSTSSVVSMSPEFDHTTSLLAMSPPLAFRQASPPLPPNRNPILLIDNPMGHQEYARLSTVCVSLLLPCPVCDWLLQPSSLPRAYKDDQGQKQQPGLRDLPNWLRENIRDWFIHRVIEQVCLSETPWSNPNLSLLQREFNLAYPTDRIRLHGNDAAVVPVSPSRCSAPTPASLQSSRHFKTLESFGTKLGKKD